MLTEYLKTTDLIQLEDLDFFLFNAISSKVQKLESIRKYCLNSRYTMVSTFNSIIVFLIWLNLIDLIDGKYVRRNSNFDKKYSKFESLAYFKDIDFCNLIMKYLKKDHELESIFNVRTLKLDIVSNSYFLHDNLIPNRFRSLLNILIQVGFFSRKQSQLYISDKYRKLIEKDLIPFLINKHQHKLKLSLDDLKKKIDLNNLHGEAAEHLVLNYELQRLANHPNIQLVKIISEVDVCAGYDIVSFNNLNSCIPDRYIEVKSYSDECTFYISRNEIETAKKYLTNYYLYLVDRNRIDEFDYQPFIIQNPYLNVFCNKKWDKFVDNWFIRRNID